MAGKIVLCRCEDVTLSDLEHCVSRGYRDIEEVKRYTGFGTGPCQGKECLAAVATQLARATGLAPSAIAPFTSRPPIAPTPIRLLARDPGAHRFEDDPEPRGEAPEPRDPRVPEGAGVRERARGDGAPEPRDPRVPEGAGVRERARGEDSDL